MPSASPCPWAQSPAVRDRAAARPPFPGNAPATARPVSESRPPWPASPLHSPRSPPTPVALAAANRAHTPGRSSSPGPSRCESRPPSSRPSRFRRAASPVPACADSASALPRGLSAVAGPCPPEAPAIPAASARTGGSSNATCVRAQPRVQLPHSLAERCFPLRPTNAARIARAQWPASTSPSACRTRPCRLPPPRPADVLRGTPPAPR